MTRNAITVSAPFMGKHHTPGIPSYVGRTAAEYEARRQGRKWNAEQRAVERLLEDCAGLELVDVPCGTGRFWSIYQNLGISALGVDISPDMRSLAESKGMRTVEGDIRYLPLPDKSCDVVVCVRLLNWLIPADQKRAWSEMRRVARKCIVFGYRGYAEADRKIFIDQRGYRIAREDL